MFELVMTAAEAVLLIAFTLQNYERMKKFHQALWRTVMLAPLLLMIARATHQNPGTFLALGLLFLLIVLASDILLIYYFIPGLGLFLLSHITNGVNFTLARPVFEAPELWFGSFAFAGALALFLAIFDAKPRGRMRVVLLAYTIVLTYSLWRAMMLATGTGGTGNFLIYGGALLFFICDLQVAYNNFISELTPRDHNVNNFIYYPGLTLLILGMIRAGAPAY